MLLTKSIYLFDPWRRNDVTYVYRHIFLLSILTGYLMMTNVNNHYRPIFYNIVKNMKATQNGFDLDIQWFVVLFFFQISTAFAMCVYVSVSIALISFLSTYMCNFSTIDIHNLINLIYFFLIPSTLSNLNRYFFFTLIQILQCDYM